MEHGNCGRYGWGLWVGALGPSTNMTPPALAAKASVYLLAGKLMQRHTHTHTERPHKNPGFHLLGKKETRQREDQFSSTSAAIRV